MPRIYSSQDDCPVAQTLNVVGDRWTLLVLRDLFRGKHRFNDLLASLTGVSPNLLANRLKRLEQQAIVARVIYSQHPPRAEYRLTRKGEDLGPVIRTMADWGEHYPASGQPAPVLPVTVLPAPVVHATAR